MSFLSRNTSNKQRCSESEGTELTEDMMRPPKKHLSSGCSAEHIFFSFSSFSAAMAEFPSRDSPLDLPKTITQGLKDIPWLTSRFWVAHEGTKTFYIPVIHFLTSPFLMLSFHAIVNSLFIQIAYFTPSSFSFHLAFLIHCLIHSSMHLFLLYYPFFLLQTLATCFTPNYFPMHILTLWRTYSLIICLWASLLSIYHLFCLLLCHFDDRCLVKSVSPFPFLFCFIACYTERRA